MLFIDLHTHTSYGSVCGYMTPNELIQQARLVGLDGVCITEHNQLWDPRAIKKLREEHDFLVIGGVEVDTDCGDILVFGLHQSVSNVYAAEELRGMVDEEGVVMIAAHPLKDLAMAGDTPGHGLTIADVARHPVFSFVDAIELYNGATRIEEIEFLIKVSKRLNMKATGGSDAHAIFGLGSCFTVFENTVQDEGDLIAEIKRGGYLGADWRSRALPISRHDVLGFADRSPGR